MKNIINQYKVYYSGREKYYHNFAHAKRVVIKGIDFLDKLHVSKKEKEIFAHAMACHDAGHFCGDQANDRENVDRALEIFDTISSQPVEDKKISRIIIDSTCVPYENIDCSVVSGINILNLVSVARDVDQIGIIGVDDELERELALIGLMREYVRAGHNREKLMDSYMVSTMSFFNSLYYYSVPGIQWAYEHQEERMEWQLRFTPRAIDIATTN
jgi:hypothetical protein